MTQDYNDYSHEEARKVALLLNEGVNPTKGRTFVVIPKGDHFKVTTLDLPKGPELPESVFRDRTTRNLVDHTFEIMELEKKIKRMQDGLRDLAHEYGNRLTTLEVRMGPPSKKAEVEKAKDEDWVKRYHKNLLASFSERNGYDE